MAAFPTLRTGVVAQYPSARELTTATYVMQFIDGAEQRHRGLHEPVRRWVLMLHQASDEELAAIEDFFIARQGAAGSFSFVDPWDGVKYPDCSFDDEFLEITARDAGRCSARLTIRNNQV